MAISAGKLMNVSADKKAQSKPKASLVSTPSTQYSVPSSGGADGAGEDGGSSKSGILKNLLIV